MTSLHVLVDLRIDAGSLNGRFGRWLHPRLSLKYPRPPYPAHLFCSLSTPLSCFLSSTAMSSTAEAAAAARAASIDAAQSATALFDTHLKLLSESYIAFFAERCAVPPCSPLHILNPSQSL